MSKKHFWFIPQLISLSRAIGGYWIPVLTLAGNWRSAFWLALVLMLTDALDGWSAKWLGVSSKFGTTILDPVCDFILGFWMLLGWITEPYANWKVWIAVTILVLACLGKGLKHQTAFPRTHYFMHGFLPFYEQTLGWLFILIYANFAYPGKLQLLVSIAIVSAVVMIRLKNYRVSDWIDAILKSGIRF